MSFAHVNGLSASQVTLRWPRRGAWVADVRLDVATALAGAVVLTLGGLALTGTVVRGGAFAHAGSHRLVAGAGRWGVALPARAYRNDAGVKRSLVLADAAREAGELLVLPSSDLSLGTAWVRRAGPAREALAQAWGTEWYVSEAGATMLGARPALPVTVTYRVLSEDPRHGQVTLATEQPEGVRPGMLLGTRAITSVQANLETNLRLQVWVSP